MNKNVSVAFQQAFEIFFLLVSLVLTTRNISRRAKRPNTHTHTHTHTQLHTHTHTHTQHKAERHSHSTRLELFQIIDLERSKSCYKDSGSHGKKHIIKCDDTK